MFYFGELCNWNTFPSYKQGIDFTCFFVRKNYLKKNFAQIPYDSCQKTVIGNDVWIGVNCLIKDGITIADGAIIGMGAVVTKNVGPYEIWAGVPARKIRTRFDQSVIDQLLSLKWWEWPDALVEEYGAYFNDPETLIHIAKEN